MFKLECFIIVEILKRHSDQEQKTQQQQARELPKYLSGQLRGADGQKVGGQQDNTKRHHEEEEPEPWQIYIYLIVEKLGYNAPVENYYKGKHVRNRKSNIQGRSSNVVKVNFHTIRNCS